VRAVFQKNGRIKIFKDFLQSQKNTDFIPSQVALMQKGKYKAFTLGRLW
jgi:hypothetical protein